MHKNVLNENKSNYIIHSTKVKSNYIKGEERKDGTQGSLKPWPSGEAFTFFHGALALTSNSSTFLSTKKVSWSFRVPPKGVQLGLEWPKDAWKTLKKCLNTIFFEIQCFLVQTRAQRHSLAWLWQHRPPMVRWLMALCLLLDHAKILMCYSWHINRQSDWLERKNIVCAQRTSPHKKQLNCWSEICNIKRH